MYCVPHYKYFQFIYSLNFLFYISAFNYNYFYYTIFFLVLPDTVVAEKKYSFVLLKFIMLCFIFYATIYNMKMHNNNNFFDRNLWRARKSRPYASENQQHTEGKAFILMIIYTQWEYWKIYKKKSYYSHHVVGWQASNFQWESFWNVFIHKFTRGGWSEVTT